MIDMAKSKSDEYQINMFIPDLHSFTTPIDHSKLYGQILHTARLFVAAGLPLDNPNIYLYRQSQISAHSELTLILNCFTGFGEMSRMTQFKDKAGLGSVFNTVEGAIKPSVRSILESNDPDIIKLQKIGMYFDGHLFGEKETAATVGLFDYPILMASDILLYNAKYIPVGDDQSQHLEFTRDIAERMNNKFGEIFTIPEAVKDQHEFFGKDQGLRIKDLIDPTKKMSKSDDSERGVIFLGDDPATAAKKVMGATTDNVGVIHLDRDNQPGISNLLEILSLLQGRALQEVLSEFEGQTSYGDFKAVVAGEVEKFLTSFQQKLAEVDDAIVIAKLEQSERDLRPVADATLLRVQQAVGLRPKDN